MIRILAALLAMTAEASAQSLWTGCGASPDSVRAQAITPQGFLVLLDALDIASETLALPGGRDPRAHGLRVAAHTDGLDWDAIFYRCGPESPDGARDRTPDEDGAAPHPVPGLAPDLAETLTRSLTRDLAPNLTQNLAAAPAQGCRDLALSAGFDLEYPVSVQIINRFNREHRFARATLTDAGAPMLSMDVNLDGGVSRAALEADIRSWRALLVSFARHIGY